MAKFQVLCQTFGEDSPRNNHGTLKGGFNLRYEGVDSRYRGMCPPAKLPGVGLAEQEANGCQSPPVAAAVVKEDGQRYLPFAFTHRLEKSVSTTNWAKTKMQLG